MNKADATTMVATVIADVVTQRASYLEAVRLRMRNGETFEEWRDSFLALTGFFTIPIFARMEARGIDREELLRAIFRETRRRASGLWNN